MLNIRSKLRSLGDGGDNIVEVLISIAVISMILGGAYVTTNKSLKGSRAAQERSDALKLVESQVESLKSIAVGTNADSIFGSGTPAKFCVVNNTTVVVSTNAGCKVAADGTATTNEPAYNISIARTNGNTFTVTNTWAAIEKNGNDQLQMTYRIYEQ